METVLVTGGSGFLGGWCVIELLQRGYAVRTTVRDPSREPEVRAAVASQVDPGDRLTVHEADLLRDDHWEKVSDGCDYVLHVASPFPPKQPKDPDELIVPARDGTLRVLRAALDAGARRVVVTSSVAAVRGGHDGADRVLDEGDWTDLDNKKLTPYVRSKTIAERAAWDLARERDALDRLAVVNPGAILGPPLGEDRSFSLEMVQRLLDGIPGTPRIGFSIVDVRDVADLQVRAMLSPEAGGERFIAVTEFRWMSEVAAVLRERLDEDEADKVPTRGVPDLVVRGMALFDPGIRSIANQLGVRVEVSGEKAKRMLDWSPRPTDETVADTARGLLATGSASS